MRSFKHWSLRGAVPLTFIHRNVRAWAHGKVTVLSSVLAGLALAFPVAAFAMYWVDGTGSAYSGPICGGEADLVTAWIGQSYWEGADAYDAIRRYSNGDVSYDVYYSGGGDHEYGTSSDVWRYTGFQDDSWFCDSSWSTTEYQYDIHA